MSFNVADLTATLRLDKGSFDRDLNSSGQQIQSLGDYARRAGSSAGQMLASGVRAASLATVALGTAAIGVTKNLLDQGIAYNTLQQTSRAALNTLMGGAQAANAQMDKLDAFAKTSPFSKSVFITAQQQLIGFGTSADRVIPTLSAINDAVAAIGGSNDDIASISFTLAQVTGTGKITGETLMQLGARGINAAEIIADGMGMTVEETRKAITKGTIDSEAALTALVDGMQTKFAGASANVKETMTGAADRVAAATRDIGAALAEPFVSKYGGGRLVQWTNDWADALRAIEKRVPGVVDVLTTRFAPQLSQVSGLILKVKTAAQEFDLSNVNRGLDTLGANAPAVGALAGAVLAFSGNALRSVPIIGSLVGGLNPLALAILGVVAASPQLRSAGADMLSELKPLIPVVVSLAESLSGALSAGVTAVIPLLVAGATVLGELVSAGIPLIEMLGGLADGFAGLPEAAQTAIIGLGLFLALRSRFAGFGEAVSGSLGRARAGMTSFSGAAKGALGVLGGPWGLAIGAAIGALSLWANSQAKARERVQEHTSALDEQTGAITETNRAIAASAIIADSNDGFYLFSNGAKSASETLKALKRSVQDTAAVVAAGGPEYDNMVSSLREGVEAMREAGPQFDNMGNQVAGNDERLRAWASSMKLSTGQLKNLTGADLSGLVAVLEEQRSAVAGSTEAWKSLNDSQAQGTPVTLELAAAIEKVGDESAETSERVRAYQTVIDQLNGKVPTAEEQQRNLAKSSRTLAEFLGEVDEAGNRVNASLVDASTGAIAMNDAGDTLNGMLGSLRDQGLAAALSASDLAKANGDAAGAAAAADAALAPFRATLQNLAEQGYLTQDQVDALSKSLFGVPGETTPIITDKDSAKGTQARVEELTRKINAVPNKDVIITEPMSPAIIGQLQNLGYVVQNLPDGTVRVVASGIAEAEAQFAWLARDRWVNMRARAIDTGTSDQGYSQGGGVGGLAAGGFLEFYANGGTRGLPPLVPMSATAAIVPANTWRVVGDNAHVPEVYAPLNGSARSLDIMRTGADRMGFTMVPKSSLRMFADGAVTGRVAQAAGQAPAAGNGHTHVHLHYGNVQTSNPKEFYDKNRRNVRDALALFTTPPKR